MTCRHPAPRQPCPMLLTNTQSTTRGDADKHVAIIIFRKKNNCNGIIINCCNITKSCNSCTKLQEVCTIYYVRRFLANVNSHSRSLYAIARPSVVCLWRSCTLLSWLKFSAIFLRHLVPWPSFDIHWKFYGDRPRGTPPSGV